MNEPEVQKLFRYDYLPDDLQILGQKFYDLAMYLVYNMHPSDERANAIQSIWAARNRSIYAKTTAKIENQNDERGAV